MLAHELRVEAKQKKKRIGRGGKTGTYCGRGGKGQSARKGYSQRATFEGGSTSIVSFSKKNRGFKVPEKYTQLVTLEQLNQKFSAGEMVNKKSLKERKLISSLKFPVKILATGEIEKKLEVEEVAASGAAVQKIEKAGGKFSAPKIKKTDKKDRKKER